MSLSPSAEFLNEDLDNGEGILEEKVSSHFIADESSSCLFDILSSAPSGHSFHSTLLEDIDLDLECEDDDIDYADSTDTENVALHTLQAVYSCNSSLCSASTASADCCKARHFIPPSCLIEDRTPGGRSYPVQDNSLQFQMSFPKACSEAVRSSKDQNLMDKKFSACRLCSILFSSKEALLMHNKDKHVKKEIIFYECTLCHVNFKSKKSLTRHNKIHEEKHGEKCSTKRDFTENCTYSCELCSYVGKTRSLLSAHIKAKHSLQRTVYTCEKCEFSCLQERTLTLHLQRHEGEPKFACDQCGKLFLTMGILKRHAHTHSKTRTFHCQFQHCGKRFNIKSRLTDHIRSVHKSKRKDLDINSNSNIFTTCRTDVHYHHSELPESSLVHEFKQSYSSKISESDINICNGTSVSALNAEDICIYDVVLPEDKIESFNSASDNKSSFRISSCSSDTKMMDNKMTCHNNQTSSSIVSKAKRSHRCDSQHSYRQMNMKQTKFACTWEGCDKTFRDNYNLYVHRCTHTGEMQRACSHCRYRCVQKSAMDAHLRTHKKMRQKDV